MVSGPRSAAASHLDTPGWEPTSAGAHLRGRPIRDTRPEVELRKAVHALGLRFRLNRRIGRYKPDLVLPRYRLAVFVDGCFWHGCPKHGPTTFRGPNADKWSSKLQANRARDIAANKALTVAGWRVLRIWECETRADVQIAAAKVLSAVQAEGGAAAEV
jgi:DNA mismatch endonuclease, patch repair protein